MHLFKLRFHDNAADRWVNYEIQANGIEEACEQAKKYLDEYMNSPIDNIELFHIGQKIFFTYADNT